MKIKSQETETESQSSDIDLRINEDIPVPIIKIDVNRSVFYILLKVSIKPTKEKQEKLTFYNVSLYSPAKKFVGKK